MKEKRLIFVILLSMTFGGCKYLTYSGQCHQKLQNEAFYQSDIDSREYYAMACSYGASKGAEIKTFDVYAETFCSNGMDYHTKKNDKWAPLIEQKRYQLLKACEIGFYSTYMK
jgi:hypothetical protein